MPAKDYYHDCVKTALVKDNWIITDDPLTVKIESRNLFIDLGAEQLLGAQKGKQKIAVEVKSFTGASDIVELERALGQCIIYQDILSVTEQDRTLYLAVTDEVASGIFAEAIGKLLIQKNRLRLVTFNPDNEEIIRWIP